MAACIVHIWTTNNSIFHCTVSTSELPPDLDVLSSMRQCKSLDELIAAQTAKSFESKCIVFGLDAVSNRDEHCLLSLEFYLSLPNVSLHSDLDQLHLSLLPCIDTFCLLLVTVRLAALHRFVCDTVCCVQGYNDDSTHIWHLQ